MAKRKRNTTEKPLDITATNNGGKKVKSTPASATEKVGPEAPLTIQLVTGSYDRVLHGITATISSDDLQFADTFLFNAHTSAIRCLALSPPAALGPKRSQKVFLASGSTDERINLYHLSLHAPSRVTVPAIPSLTSTKVVENPHNRELGSLMHHSSAITALYFPNRAKLMSSSEDRNISIVRTRDWSTLSSIKTPAPKMMGRPSGDTAPTGYAPSGVNDFAVHPSMKLMISVSKGERCMRLWNLVTGKKAGVLNFDKAHLDNLGEERHSTGEGRKVAWGCNSQDEEFCVGFERGLLVFGMDSEPRCRVFPEPRTKIHQVKYVQGKKDNTLLAVSTEDGRILFYSTRQTDLIVSTGGKTESLPSARLVSQLGGKEVQLSGRVKDFSVLEVKGGESKEFIVVAAGSDGSLRLWRVSSHDLMSLGEKRQVGKLLGTYNTNNRITCLVAYIMLPSVDSVEGNEIEESESSEDEDDTSNSE
ncbi:hypothetical protein K3495_g518 [Podosphaera aphanis]|nr:hypothetical protein K3495_g518 [Podosphaera aphanis]